MELPEKIRVGIVGVGRMGRYHLEKFLSLPEADVVGCFEPNPETALQLTQKYPTRVFSDLAELFFEVDAVVLASPTPTHAMLAAQALKAGLHVLVEKPLAATVAEARALVETARESSRVLQVGMVERFRLASLSQGLELGPARFLETHRLTPHLPRETQIDVVSDLMIHDLDLALSLVHEDPVSVSAIGMSVLTSQVDVANVRLEFESGTVMNLNASRVSTEIVRKLRLFTDRAYASFDFQQNRAVVFTRSENGVEKNQYQSEGVDPLLEQSRDFLRCAREGSRPLVGGEDGLRALKYADLVRDKIRQRNQSPQSPERNEGKAWPSTF